MSKKSKNSKNWLLYILLIGFIFKFFKLIFGCKKTKHIKDNIRDFAKKEEEEIKELATGKESFKKFCSDSGSLVRDYFVPHHGNDHKPKILHRKSLATIGMSLLLLKVAVTSYLFFIYPNQAFMSQSMIQEVLELTNQDRTANKVPSLLVNPVLNLAANAKAQDMIDNDYFSHYSPDGKKPWEWINRDKYPYLFVGENLAMNFSSANSAHTALMNSPDHKKNILNDRYNEVGLAIISGNMDGKDTNILVELFATRQTQYLAASEVEKVPTPEEKIAEALESAKTEPEPKTEAGESVKENTIEEVPKKHEPVKEIIEEKEAPVSNTIAMQEEEALPNEIELKGIEVTEKLETEKLIAKSEVEANPSLVLGADNSLKPVSPNKDLENNKLKVVSYSPNQLKQQSFAVQIVNASQYVLWAVLALVTLALFVNIIVRISIQHKGVIAETFVLILFITGLINIKLHFIEKMVDLVAII